MLAVRGEAVGAHAGRRGMIYLRLCISLDFFCVFSLPPLAFMRFARLVALLSGRLSSAFRLKLCCWPSSLFNIKSYLSHRFLTLRHMTAGGLLPRATDISERGSRCL